MQRVNHPAMPRIFDRDVIAEGGIVLLSFQEINRIPELLLRDSTPAGATGATIATDHRPTADATFVPPRRVRNVLGDLQSDRNVQREGGPATTPIATPIATSTPNLLPPAEASPPRHVRADSVSHLRWPALRTRMTASAQIAGEAASLLG